MHQPLMTVAELEAFLDREFPQIHHGGRSYMWKRSALSSRGCGWTITSVISGPAGRCPGPR